MTESLLSFHNVSFAYQKDTILTDVSFSLRHGELAFLVGKSGCGKSTLLQLIYANLKPDSGIVRFDDYISEGMHISHIPKLRRKLGIVFQNFRLLPTRTVAENLSFVMEMVGVPKNIMKERLNQVLLEVGLSHRKKSFPNELSGGEQQRIAIARAVINEPLLVIADEPTGNLDPETAADIMTLMIDINRRGTAVLIATHNYDLLKQASVPVLLLKNGSVTISHTPDLSG